MPSTEDQVQMIATAMTECAYSEEGCQEIPVTAIEQMSDETEMLDGKEVPIMDVILLCKKHAAEFASRN